MKSFIKSIGIILMSIGLLGLTSGCGKKLMRGSSGSDHNLATASVKSVALAEKMPVSEPLVGPDKIRLSREIDLAGDKSIRESPPNFESSISQEGTDSMAGDLSRLNKGLVDQANLTTPEHESSDVSDQVVRQKGVTFSNGLQDIYFAFDSWRLTEKSRRVLEANAEWLKGHAHERITIEGHCDERGTQAYNYVLGEKRATMVQQYLGFLGVPHQQLVVTSFGKDKPKCHAYSENCFQQNRRAHFGSDLNLASN